MSRLTKALATVTVACLGASTASADELRGKIVQTQGHIRPECRMVQLKRSDNGGYIWFRIAATGKENGVLAATLTALTTQLDVDVWYDPNVTTGCGSEPQIGWISLRAANAS